MQRRFQLHIPACVCVYEQGNEMERRTNIYRQNGGSHKGPAEPPEPVWLEPDHHLNVLAEPLQACGGRREERKERGGGGERERPGFNEVRSSKFNPFSCAR